MLLNYNIVMGRVNVFVLLILCLFVSNVYVVGGLPGMTGFVVNTESGSSEGFDLNSLLIKVSVRQGDSVEKVLSIVRGNGQQIFLNIINIEGVSLSEDSFVLNQGETKNINVYFNSSKLEAGAYVGSIKISDSKEVVYLPVIFEVETKDLFYDINLDIPPQYSEIAPGEKLVAQMKIFDLTSGGTQKGLGANNVKMEYYIYGLDGSFISSESESLVIDKQTQVTKTLLFPESTPEGSYIFVSLVKYGSSVGISSYVFNIIKDKSKGNFFGGNLDNKFIIVLVIVVLLFFSLIFFFVYLVRDRDKLILSLKGHNSSELRMQEHILSEQAKLLSRKNKVSPLKIRNEINQKVNRLKKKQEERIKHVRRLKKKGNINEMKKRINEWKKEGYNTFPVEYKLKGLSESEMKKILNKWRERYSGERRV